ncbi:MAG: hypothetical protein HZA54_03060, partial [Planctomycetes bacterium]|nr:hypothetical protein [Planctomycetota bacterium]
DRLESLGGGARAQAEAARMGRDAVQALLRLTDRTAEFRALLEEEGELFTGVVDQISLRPGVTPGTYPIDRDLVDPEPGFHFKEGHARVALAVGEVNAGNEGRAQRYFLEALRHLLWAGLCGRPTGRGQGYLEEVCGLLEGRGGGGSAGPGAGAGTVAGPPGAAELANQRTILDYLQSVFRNLRRLSTRRGS